MDFTSALNTPEVFRLWGAISAVAGALERRVWVRSNLGDTFANLFVVLAATPGIGKTKIIQTTTDLLAETKIIHIAPTSVSKASLLDTLGRSIRTLVLSESEIDEFSCLFIGASELESLLPSGDPDMMAVLRELWDNRPFYQDVKRTTLKEPLWIPKPQVNLLAGDTPARLMELLPEAAWGGGFAARLLFVYADSTPDIDPFSESASNGGKEAILAGLKALAEVYGQCALTPEAVAALRAWRSAGMSPVPDHPRLQHYRSRRFEYTLKLSIVSGLSTSGRPLIDVPDVQRAIQWLLQMEARIPAVFRAMSGKSDIQVLQELFNHLWWRWNTKEPGKPISGAIIYQFLVSRVPADKIRGLVLAALGANMLSRIGEDAFVPNPKSKHGETT